MSFTKIKNQNVEASAHTNAQGTSPLSVSVTTLSKNALVIVGYANQNAQPPTFSTGETTGFDKTVGAAEDSECYGGYRTLTTAGSTTSTLTATNPQSEVLLIASFASTQSGGGFFAFF